MRMLSLVQSLKTKSMNLIVGLCSNLNRKDPQVGIQAMLALAAKVQHLESRITYLESEAIAELKNLAAQTTAVALTDPEPDSSMLNKTEIYIINSGNEHEVLYESPTFH